MTWTAPPREMTEAELRHGFKDSRDLTHRLVYDQRVPHAKEIAWKLYRDQFKQAEAKK